MRENYFSPTFVIHPKQVAELNKIFYDSPDYKLIIHPLTIKEAEKIKDNKKKEVFKSKLDLYKKIDKPLLAPLEFHNKLGFKNEHDKTRVCLKNR